MKKGFTLIEIVIVIALILILSVSLGPRVLKTINKAKVSEVMPKLDGLRRDLWISWVEHGEHLPGGGNCSRNYNPVEYLT